MQEDEEQVSPAYRKKGGEREMIMLVYHRARLLFHLARLSFHSGVSCNDPGGPWASGCLKFSPALTSRSTPSFNKGPEWGHGHPFIFLLLFVNISEAVKQLLFREQRLTDPWMTEVCSIAGNSSDGSGLDTMAHICHLLHEYVLTEMGKSPYMNHSVHAVAPY